MTDLTKITSAFCLLDTATQLALRAHGGPYEFLDRSGLWEEIAEPGFMRATVYRVKPQPPKPREIWTVGPFNRATKAECEWLIASGHAVEPITRWREAPPDE